MICLAVGLVVCTGCTFDAKTYGREQVPLGKPDKALMAEDGTLLLRFHVNRQLQPDYAGWHWLVVDPVGTNKMFDPDTLGNEGCCGWNYLYIDWQGDNANAQLVPPILEPGLADGDTPPIEGRELVEWDLIPDGDNGRLRLSPIGDGHTGGRYPVITPNLSFTPYSMVYQSDKDKRREKTARVFSAPFRFVGGAAVLLILSPWIIAWLLTAPDKSPI